ncbi:MAG: PhzF family phenazine biosynthesis protein [Rickettsiales bacterium]
MHNLWIIDSFTPIPFRGSPVAVYLLDEFPVDKRMQLLSARANLGEAAFVVKNSPLNFHLRWFSPFGETLSCGHATVAAAHVLAQTGQAQAGDIVTFNTAAGLLKTKIIKNRKIEIDLPSLPGKQVNDIDIEGIIGTDVINCEKNDNDYLVEVKNLNTLFGIKPNVKKLSAVQARGIIITTATATRKYDFASRFFAANGECNEYPVSVFAHCFLAPYWKDRLDKTEFLAMQASKTRGEVKIELDGERLLIRGNCITALKDMINLSNKNSKKEAIA